MFLWQSTRSLPLCIRSAIRWLWIQPSWALRTRFERSALVENLRIFCCLTAYSRRTRNPLLVRFGKIIKFRRTLTLRCYCNPWPLSLSISRCGTSNLLQERLKLNENTRSRYAHSKQKDKWSVSCTQTFSCGIILVATGIRIVQHW